MSENESISDEQLSIIANIIFIDLENRVEELHGVVKHGEITKSFNKITGEKTSKISYERIIVDNRIFGVAGISLIDIISIGPQLQDLLLG